MALIQFCCCWSSLLSGCYASAFYTMIYFTVTITMVTIFGVADGGPEDEEQAVYQPPEDPATLKALNISVVTLSSTGLGTTFLLLYGLVKKRRALLIPWIIIMTGTTSVDLIYAVYLLAHVESMNAISATVFAGDFILVIINGYCILCVVSQYQEFKENGPSTAHGMIGLAITDDFFDMHQLPVEEMKLSELLEVNLDETNTAPGETISRGEELWIECAHQATSSDARQCDHQCNHHPSLELSEPGVAKISRNQCNIHAIRVDIESLGSESFGDRVAGPSNINQRRVTFNSLTNTAPS